MLIGAGAAIDACASRPGEVFGPADAGLRWPPPPDRARVRYVGALASDRDLKPGVSFGQSVGRALFGRDPAREMVSPMGVCCDGGDRVFVADPGIGGVHVFDLRTRRYALWRTPEEGPRLVQPVAVAVIPGTGRLLVCDSAAQVVVVFDAQGGFLGTMGDRRLERPCGLAVDGAGGRLFIADAGAHQVVCLTLDDVEVARIGGRGSGPGEFNFPTSVAWDPRGRLYVSDTLNFRVQVFDASLAPVLQMGSKGDMPGYFAQPKGVAVGPEGYLFVVDAHFEAVQVFNDQGSVLMAMGHEGTGPGEFWLPVGIFTDERGRIWVADSYNRRVQVFEYIPEGAQP